jgi:hypothetical protein
LGSQTTEWVEARIRETRRTIRTGVDRAPERVAGIESVGVVRHGREQTTRVLVPAARVATLNLPLRMVGPPKSDVFDKEVSILGTIDARCADATRSALSNGERAPVGCAAIRLLAHASVERKVGV